MKNFIYIISIFSLAFVMVGCGEPDYPEPTPSVTTLSSKLTIIDVHPTDKRFKIRVDNRFTAKDTVRFVKAPDGKLYNTITLAVPAGPNRNIAVTEYTGDAYIVTDRYAATAATNNTSFIVLNGDKTVVTRVADDLVLPDPGMAKLRFFHFANGVADLKIVNTADGTTTFSIRKFNDAKADFARFTTIPAGTYNFEARNANDEVIFVVNNLKLDSKGIYTLYAKGIIDGTVDLAVSYGVFKH
ncbi:DUF4397 domain-containing protein [Pseudochryseolinea flava]|uniref:DUF4397 domain-containing protein n=1 Tax=Pseudochryseolinea flava TaxID=2059302 RepID=A0A364Y8A7_9BACT|nr:DUF4397 domain-containing protein [Pseudochryseolinea flava]RAW02715.1 hypothetical protein DQQ10_00995 [Pseudochryseolinea flava]